MPPRSSERAAQREASRDDFGRNRFPMPETAPHFDLIDRLAESLGEPKPLPPKRALDWLAWDNVGYLDDDGRRGAAASPTCARSGYARSGRPTRAASSARSWCSAPTSALAGAPARRPL